MKSDRNYSSGLVTRVQATPEIEERVAAWTVWETNASEPFEIHYDRGVSFCVKRGRAEIAFSDGTVLDVQPGDYVTIHPDIRGVWTIIGPITNLYMYHEAGFAA